MCGRVGFDLKDVTRAAVKLTAVSAQMTMLHGKIVRRTDRSIGSDRHVLGDDAKDEGGKYYNDGRKKKY